MFSKKQTHGNRIASKQRSLRRNAPNPGILTQQARLAAVIQQAQLDHDLLTPKDVLWFQRTLGNQQVNRLLTGNSQGQSQGTRVTHDRVNPGKDGSPLTKPITIITPGSIQLVQRVFYLGDRMVRSKQEFASQEKQKLQEEGLWPTALNLAKQPPNVYDINETKYKSAPVYLDFDAFLTALRKGKTDAKYWNKAEGAVTMVNEQGVCIKVWSSKSSVTKESLKYFCHGHAFGTYVKYGYSPTSDKGMKALLQKNYTQVNDMRQSGDLSIWFKDDVITHSAIYNGTNIPNRAQVKIEEIDAKHTNSPETLLQLTERIEKHEALVVYPPASGFDFFGGSQPKGTLKELQILANLQENDEIRFTFGNQTSKFKVTKIGERSSAYSSKNGESPLFYDTLSYLNDFYKTTKVRYYRKL
jgi:hypothetical protein